METEHEGRQTPMETGPKFPSFQLILQHWSAMHLLHYPMESCSKYYKKRAITESSKYTIQHNLTKMTTIQSVQHAFSSASNVTVSPFQQSPNTSLYIAKMRKQITKRKKKYTTTNKLT